MGMRIGPALLAAAVLLALAGCVPSAAPSTAEPSASATPVFASDAEALAAAEKAYAAYQEVSDQIGADGGSEPERLIGLVTGKLKQSDLIGYQKLRTEKWHVVGSTKVSAATLQSADLSSAAAKDAVFVYLCLDVSGVDVLDIAGNSVVSATRPSSQAFLVSFDRLGKKLLPSSRNSWTGPATCKS